MSVRVERIGAAEWLSRDVLHSLLRYDPSDGTFVGADGAVGTNRKAGAKAGSINGKGYVSIALRGRCFLGHRLAWLYVHGRWPIATIDHINGVRSDNRIVNLREASLKENNRNSRAYGSGPKGTTYRKSLDCWDAKIFLDGRAVHLGRFSTAEEAHQAYRDAAIRHFGEFARFS